MARCGLQQCRYPGIIWIVAVGKITKRAVEAIPLPVGTARSYLWDDTLKGFGVMVTGAGSRSYLVQYQMGGRGAPTRRATIGRHGSPWTAEKARDRATDLLELIRRGVDPVDEQRRQREAAEATKKDDARLAFDAYIETFGTLYLDRGGRKKEGGGKPLRSAEDVKALLRREWVPVFGSRSLSKITKREISARLDLIEERSPSAAVKAHKWLRTLLSWAEKRDDITASPMETLGAPGTDAERERWLKEWWELKAVWLGADAMPEPYRSFVQALMLTGQRLREVAGMRWSEVDLAAAVWIIPGARTKNKADHLVPLAPVMVTLLTALHPDPKLRKGPVFTTGGEKPINGFSKPKAKLDGEVGKALGKIDTGELPMLQPWVFHDLRRTFSSGLQALGFSHDHIHAALNQLADGKRAKLQRTYQRYEYQAEKATMMQAWARHLTGTVSGEIGNVVTLAAARA
jgi:integrase